MKRANKFMSWLMVSFMLVMTLAPLSALAQTTPASGDLYTLDEDDLSRTTFIDPLFGPISGSDTDSPLTDLMLVFNGILLTVGGILVLYSILSGALATAHDGEMLGRGKSTLWIPLRTAFAAAVMMPVVGGGWCLAQVVVIWLAMQGAAMANVMWDKFLDNGQSIVTSASYAPPSSLSAVRQTYTTMFTNAVCVASKEGARAASGSDAELMGKMQYESRILSNTRDNFTIAYGDASVLGWYLKMSPAALLANPVSTTDCGMIKMDESPNWMTKQYNGLTNNTGAMLFDLRSDSEKLTGPVSDARRAEFVMAKSETDLLAAKLVTEGLSQTEFNEKMNEMLKRYSDNVSAKAKESFSEHINADFIDKIRQDGWVMAGAFYMQMSVAQDQITQSISNAPATVLPRVDDSRLAGSAVTAVKEFFAGENKYLEDARMLVGNYVSASAGGVAGLGNSAASGDDGNWSAKLVNWFINEDGALGAGTMDVNQNPVIMAKGLGEKMTATAWGALAAAGIAGLWTIGGAGVGSAVLLSGPFMLMFSTLLVPGAILSSYLPMMPYIMWLGVILAWAIMLVEAVIAAPLWALAHLAPDGDGVVGRGGQGYMLILSLVLRPPLMILGLVAAFVLMKPIGFLVNSTFVGAFNMSVQPGFFSLTQTAAGCVIYCIIMIMLVQRVFSLIHVVPDRLLRWIGGDQGGVGEQAAAAQEGWQKAGVALGAHTAIGELAQRGLADAGAHGRQNKQLKATESAEKRQKASDMEDTLHSLSNDAFAAGSRADRSGDVTQGIQAAHAFEGASNAAYKAAEAHAEAYKDSPTSSKFLDGLSDASEQGPNQKKSYLQQQGKEAFEQREAYRGARDRAANGKESAADREIIANYVPHPVTEALADGYQHQQEAESYYRRVDDDSLAPREAPGDSVRETKRGRFGDADGESTDMKDFPSPERWDLEPKQGDDGGPDGSPGGGSGSSGRGPGNVDGPGNDGSSTSGGSGRGPSGDQDKDDHNPMG